MVVEVLTTIMRISSSAHYIITYIWIGAMVHYLGLLAVLTTK